MGEYIKKARRSKKLTQEDLAKHLREKFPGNTSSRSYIGQVEIGASLPSPLLLSQIAEILELDVNKLLTLLGQEKIRRQKLREKRKQNLIPLLLGEVSAGRWFNKDSIDIEPEEYIEAPPRLNDPQAVAIRVDGDSMAPKIEQGDIVIAAPSIEPQNGDIGIIIKENEEVCIKKIFFQNHGVLLQPLNPSYHPEFIPNNQIKRILKVIWIKPK